jgi:hypothetical protein
MKLLAMKTARTISASRKPCAAGTSARPEQRDDGRFEDADAAERDRDGTGDRRRGAGQHDGRQADLIAHVRQDQLPDREDQRGVADARQPEAERGAAMAAHARLHAAGLDQDGGEQAPRGLQQAAARNLGVRRTLAEPIEDEHEKRDAARARTDNERAQPGLQPRASA